MSGKSYPSLQAAIDAATRNATVKLLADTHENVTISANAIKLDLNGHTLNGSTVKASPALTINNTRVTVQDSSEAQTGTIMREDTAENSGVSSHYVIDVQGKNGFLLFNGGTVKNNSGTANGAKGSSLVRVGNDRDKKSHPVVTIAGGTFTQDNFIAIKVDFGTLYVKGGVINSKNSYAVENWLNANIKDNAVINGNVSSWTYAEGSNSNLNISGGTVNGNVESVTYDGAEGKTAKVSITGGTVNGTLSASKYNSTEINDPTKATIEVTGGTFNTDPSRYLVEGSTVAKSEDGTFDVAKAYLAQVGKTSYYTMDEARKAQTKSGEAITLLRDYTTGSTFSSGTVARAVDLNGHTWTCTGTDANSAAFEINYPNASLTVKNGKIVSSQLIGLIPSASGGTITYDNSILTFEGVEASTTATSGIETNGNNTNDTVVLKNSTLNVPNGFGIYFPSSGTLTIDNSTINAKTMGAQVCSGSLNVNAGSAITVSGDPVAKTENDGAIQDGAAISVVNRPGYKGLGKVAITGGTFTAKTGNAALKAYTWDSSTNQESAFDSSANTVAVSGGTFSAEVPADCCAKDFTCIKNSNGTYGVAQKGEEVKPSEENKNSGSVATNGVTVEQDEQKKVAQTAAEAAASVKDATVDETKNEAKIGDVTVDTSAEGKAEEVKIVTEAAKEDNNSVSVRLVVKADQNVAANSQIVDTAKNATVVPFELSVDMVTEVKGADNQVVATASVPVKETTEPITVTIKVNPQSIAGKNVMVARVHDGKLELIEPSKLNPQKGEVTFETAKFSDYAVVASEMNKSYKLEDYTDATGTRKTINNAEFNVSSDYAFAGWYKDPEFTEPYETSDVSGDAYPMFVKIGEYIQYMGGSLRMDGPAASESTSLRFGYITSVPDGAKYIDSWWTWNDGLTEQEPVHAANRVLFSGGAALANLVVTTLKAEYYTTTFHVTEHLKYQTVDGTTVEVAETASHQHSAKTVAKAVLDNPGASPEEMEYAQQILETIGKE